MRVAIVSEACIPVPPPKYGGTEQIIHYLIKGLKEAGHEPILLGPGDSTEKCRIIPIADKSVPIPLSRDQLPEYTNKINEIKKFTSDKLRSLLPEIDIIHSHTFDLEEFRDFPNLTTLHGIIYFGNLNYLLKRKDLYYVTVSKSQQAVRDLNYAGTVYNGEDPDSFPFVKNPKDYVCFLGRFDREKNPHLAIQLAISLGIKIKVAGKIDLQAEGYFKDEVEKYFDHPLVEFLGELDFGQKIELLSNAKCNLHPANFREPFGLTVLEAAYCGTPTLATARGAMPEVIEAGKTGILVEDFVEGYNKIQACYEMDRDYIAQRSRKLFNYKSMTSQYIKIYENIINAMRQKHPLPSRKLNLASHSNLN